MEWRGRSALVLTLMGSLLGTSSAQSPATPGSGTRPIATAETQPLTTAITPAETILAPEAPPSPYEGDLHTRLRLTGDWCGHRTMLAEKGLTFDFFATQFSQGIVAGGLDQRWETGAKLDYLINVDGGKLGLWQGLFVNVHGETRLGRDVNGIDGLLAPSNIPMSFPEAERNISSLTGLKITQAFSENFAIYFGKINTLDEYPLRYSPGLGTNKPGLAGFMNTSLVFNPIGGRTVPYSAAGVGAAFLSEGEPVFTFSVFDPEERATKGLDDLFDRGAVFVPDLILRGKLFGLPGLLNLGGTYSTAKYRSFDPASYLNVAFLRSLANRAPVTPLETGSWCGYANFYQSVWADPTDEGRNWGIFGQFGLSDGNPNPIRFVANGGIGGRSMIPGRTLDTFGVGYFYLGLSDKFKSLARPFQPQRDEIGVEAFYNLAITPWARLTTDIQIVRPSNVNTKTTVIPGLRFQVLF